MTSVADVARELSLPDGVVLAACTELDIVASSSASGLSSSEHVRLRDHFGADHHALGDVPRGSTDRDPHAAAEGTAEVGGHHTAPADTWSQIRDEQRMWKFFGRGASARPRTDIRRLVRWSVAGFGLVAVGIALFTLSRDDAADVVTSICVDFTAEGTTSAVDCTDPHDAEIVAQFEVPAADGAEHPGADALLATAQARCPSPAELDDDTTGLRSVFLVPTAITWAEGDRTVLCLVEDPAAPLVGPVGGG